MTWARERWRVDAQLRLLKGWADQLADILIAAPGNKHVSTRVIEIIGTRLSEDDLDRLVRMVRRKLRNGRTRE